MKANQQVEVNDVRELHLIWGGRTKLQLLCCTLESKAGWIQNSKMEEKNLPVAAALYTWVATWENQGQVLNQGKLPQLWMGPEFSGSLSVHRLQ